MPAGPLRPRRALRGPSSVSNTTRDTTAARRWMRPTPAQVHSDPAHRGWKTARSGNATGSRYRAYPLGGSEFGCLPAPPPLVKTRQVLAPHRFPKEIAKAQGVVQRGPMFQFAIRARRGRFSLAPYRVARSGERDDPVCQQFAGDRRHARETCRAKAASAVAPGPEARGCSTRSKTACCATADHRCGECRITSARTLPGSSSANCCATMAPVKTPPKRPSRYQSAATGRAVAPINCAMGGAAVVTR